MQNQEVRQPSGSLRISQDVIATIANYTATEIDGVTSINNNSLTINKIVGGKKIMKTTSIDLNDDVAVIDMFINLKYGTKIHEIAEDIQSAVKEAVQTMTGITVSKVNLHVDGIKTEETNIN